MQYGLIGEKLSHSFSKEIHEQIENYTYTLCELKPNELERFINKKDFSAINVTVPYKEKVIPYLDNISERAKAIGSVNTIVNRSGKLYGYNTDALGLSDLMHKADVLPRGKKVLVLGTGGTSKTASVVLSELGAREIVIVGRTSKKGSITYDEMYELHTDADIIINTTPCGMYPDCYDSPVDLTRFPSLCGVLDVIYNPLRSSLVTQAKNMGIKASGGLYMLVSQAIYAVEKFVGRNYDKTLVDKIYNSIKLSKENIVLIGMPSCGKSTVAKELSNLTKRELIDIDQLIVNTHKMSITDIFAKFGEEVFRKWESEAIKEAAKKSGAIIATGGGAVLNKHNVDALRQNGRIYFIDRPLEMLFPTSDRPLAQNTDAIIRLYDERYPIYMSAADSIVINNKSISELIDGINLIHTHGGENV